MAEKIPTYFFVRHSRLLLPYKDHSEMPFSVLSKLGLQELNPSIDMPYTLERLEELIARIPLLDVDAVYTSPSKRTQDTGAVICAKIKEIKHKEMTGVVLPHLREVSFDLEKLGQAFDGETLMKERGIAGANTLVFKGMVSGTHADLVEATYERVGALFEEIKKLGNGKYIFLTHDFFMRVIEIYIHRKGAPYSAITIEHLEGTRRNTYLTGFSTNPQLDSFSIVD